jgi:bacillithiol biosynthesis cysteine-adding enzyme BshC
MEKSIVVQEMPDFCGSQESPFAIENLTFSDVPGQSGIFVEYQQNPLSLKKYYPEVVESHTQISQRIPDVLANYKTDRNLLCDALEEANKKIDAGKKTLENIKLLREPETVAVVTGQQAGLFSGPLYTIYKALSTVKLTECLRGRGVRAVPVFWIAEEDHDFDEIKKTFVLDKEGKLAELENQPGNLPENLPVGFIKLDKTIRETIENLFETIPRTEFSGDIHNLLSETYKSGESYSTSFAKFLAKILNKYGIIFFPPLDEDLKKLCAPVFSEAIEKSDEISAGLLKRKSELETAEYHTQVLVEENSFPFFWINENGERKALRRDLKSGKIKVQNSKVEFTKQELKSIAGNEPQNLSPNALMRPIIQDYLLPTILYFGGAAEIAYFAQNSVIYEILIRPVTPIQHRASFTIIEPKHRRTMEKYDLQFSDLFKGNEEILAKVVENFLNNGTAREFAEVEEIINTQLNRLDRHLLESEPTLSENLANRRRKIIWHIGALRKKYHRAEIFKNEVVRRRIETLFAALLPHNALQERTLNVITFLNLYGVNFIDWIYEAIDLDDKEHRIVFL